MKNYRLAVDENGSPFVLNSKGSIDFGYITEEMNLSPAPIRVAEGFNGPKGYGLKHIIEGHEKEILNSGYESIHDFIEDVVGNFTEIKEGDYWKIISGGIFRIKYSKNKKIIHSASEVQTSPPAEDDPLPFEEDV